MWDRGSICVPFGSQTKGLKWLLTLSQVDITTLGEVVSSMSWETGWWGAVADIDKQTTQSSFSRHLDTSWCQCAFSRPCACGNRVGPRRELLERAVSRFDDQAFQQRQKKRHEPCYILLYISILCQRKTQTGWKRVDMWCFVFHSVGFGKQVQNITKHGLWLAPFLIMKSFRGK